MMKKQVLLAILLLFVSYLLYAQKDSETVTVNFSITATSTLTVNAVYDHDETNQTTFTKNDNGNGQVDFGSIGLIKDNYSGLNFGEHIIGGSTAHAIEMTVVTNEGAWTLKGKGTGDFTSGVNSVPLSRLKWALNDGSTWTSFTTTAANITTGNSTNGTQVNLDLKIQLDSSDTVATGYTTDLVFELF